MDDTKASVTRSCVSFPTTHWTTLLKPISERTDEARDALNRLVERYRPPIVSLVRSLARRPHQVDDIAHAFILRLLSRNDIEKADRNKGRFRAFLSTSIRNFVISFYQAEDSQKRSPTNRAVPLDTSRDPGIAIDAEKEFTRKWWRATIDEAIHRVRGEWEAAGKVELFDQLEPFLWSKDRDVTIKSLAARCGATPTAVSLRKARLIGRVRAVLREVVGETVGSPRDVEEEIRLFFENP